MRTVLNGHLLYDSPSTATSDATIASIGGQNVYWGYHYVGSAATDYPTDGNALEYQIAGGVTGENFATEARVNGEILAWPFLVGRTGTLDEIQIEVTAGNAAGRLGRVAIYNNASRTRLYPTTRVVDSGSIDFTAAGLKTVSVSATLTAGQLYWATYATNNSTPVLRSITSASMAPWGSSKSSAPSLATFTGFSFNKAFPGLDDPFPAAGTGTLGASAVARTGNYPVVMLHFSA